MLFSFLLFWLNKQALDNRANRRREENTLPFGYLAVWGAVRGQFHKPDIFPTTITSRSSGQKAGLTQSSSRLIA
jgi:hypothetical protein